MVTNLNCLDKFSKKYSVIENDVHSWGIEGFPSVRTGMRKGEATFHNFENKLKNIKRFRN